MKRRKEAVAKLREITEVLNGGSVIGYSVDRGCSVGWGLFKDDSVAVQRNELAAGTVFPEHVHDNEAEWIVIYKGTICFWYGDGEQAELGPGDYIQFGPGVPHRAEVGEACRMIAITIPADEGYPDAR